VMVAAACQTCVMT